MDPAIVVSAIVGAATLVKDALEWFEQHRQNGQEVVFLQRRKDLLMTMVLDLQEDCRGDGRDAHGVLQPALEAVVISLCQAGDAVNVILSWNRARRLIFTGDVKNKLVHAQSRLSNALTDMAACLQIECYRALTGLTSSQRGKASLSPSPSGFPSSSPSGRLSSGSLSATPPTPQLRPEAFAGQDVWEERRPDPRVATAVEQLRVASNIPTQLAALSALQLLLDACSANQAAVPAAGGLTLVVRKLCCDGHPCVLANTAAVLRRLVAGHGANQEAAAADEELLPSLAFWLGCGHAQVQEACLDAFCELTRGQPGLLRRVAAPGSKLIPALMRLLEEGASLVARSHAAEALYSLTRTCEACRARVAAELAQADLPWWPATAEPHMEWPPAA